MPMRLSESQVPMLLPFVCRTNSDEIVFLGKTYQPQTLRFIKFTPTRTTAAYFYGVATIDFQVNKAVGEVPFTPLQDLVHG